MREWAQAGLVERVARTCASDSARAGEIGLWLRWRLGSAVMRGRSLDMKRRGGGRCGWKGGGSCPGSDVRVGVASAGWAPHSPTRPRRRCLHLRVGQHDGGVGRTCAASRGPRACAGRRQCPRRGARERGLD